MSFVVCSGVLSVVAVEIVTEGKGDEKAGDDNVS